jgi:hypothetical protein
MTFFIPILAFLAFLALYSSLLRLAAKILSIPLQWRLCLQYSLLAFVLSAITRTIGRSAATMVLLTLSLSSQLALGTFFIGAFAKNSDGTPLGRKAGLKITAVFLGLLLAFSLLMLALAFAIHKVFATMPR